MTFIRFLIVISVALVFSACETVPKATGISVAELDEDPRVLHFTLPETPHGRMVVDAGLPNGRIVKLVLDTGATRSALYAPEWESLNLAGQDAQIIRIHGMIAADMQPIVTLPTLQLGTATLKDTPFARLNVPERAARDKEIHDGILGMDILSQYHLYIDRPAGILKMVPNSLGALTVPPSWRIVTLKSNPFLEDGRELHFLDIRLGNALTPALLDTGSEFNLMNWNTSRFPQLRAAKRRLLKQWEIDGAVGTFTPVSKIRATDYRAGQKVFDGADFIILDFESLDVLGIEDNPFIILGSQALMTERYIIDFNRDELVFAPTNEEKNYKSRAAMPTFTKRLRK